MIENMGVSLYFVGATIGRPPEIVVNLTGDQWSPLHKQSIEFALIQCFTKFKVRFNKKHLK